MAQNNAIQQTAGQKYKKAIFPYNSKERKRKKNQGDKMKRIDGRF